MQGAAFFPAAPGWVTDSRAMEAHVDKQSLLESRGAGRVRGYGAVPQEHGFESSRR